jgi:hypothetical protein
MEEIVELLIAQQGQIETQEERIASLEAASVEMIGCIEDLSRRLGAIDAWMRKKVAANVDAAIDRVTR